MRAANAGPVTEDEVTEWIATAGKSPCRPTPPGAAGAGARCRAGIASWLGAGLAALIVIPALVLGSLSVVAVRHLTGTRGSSPPSAAPARHEAAVRGGGGRLGRPAGQPGRDGVLRSGDVRGARGARVPRGATCSCSGRVSPDPRHSDVVVETAAVRALFGTSLDLAWAPAVLASFGSGSAGITVRVVASHGAVAYQTALVGDLAARKAAGARLLADRRISVPAPARAQLTAGLVDLRLLSALTALSRHQPVSLVEFGNVGPGASPGVPLRFADLSQASRRPG